MDVHGIEVRGIQVVAQTRCAHYDSDLDIVALKFACCDTYYPCFRCHAETTTHSPIKWPASQFDAPAVLCGGCGTELPVRAYLGVTACPACSAPFNPGCTAHYHLYFEGFEPPDEC